MTTTLKFPDVSHHQAPLSLAGAPVVIAKATEGTGFIDPSYSGFKGQAAQLGAPFMGYHWLNTEDLQAQAQNAFNVVRQTPLMWDAEALGVTVPRLRDITLRYRDLGGVVHMLYLPAWWWHDHMGAPDLTPLVDIGLYLISSNYPSNGYTENGPGWIPYGGMTPVQWQYTSTQAFNGKLVDFNAYKGTVAQYAALISGAPAPVHRRSDMANFFHVGDSQYIADSNFERFWAFSGPNAFDIFSAVLAAAGSPPIGAATAAQRDAGYFGAFQGTYAVPRTAPASPVCPPCVCNCDCNDTPPAPTPFNIIFNGTGTAQPSA